PALAAEVPHPGKQGLRILRIHRDHRAAGREVRALQDLRPRLAAVGRFVDAAVFAVGPQPSGSAGVDGVRLRRVDQDLRDPFRAPEADVGPVVAAVDRLVDAIADRDAVAGPGLAGSHPDDLGVLRVDRDRADRLDRLLVEDGFVGRAAVDRLPDTAGG